MSGATAAFRIVKRQLIAFETEDDEPMEIVSRRDRYSWLPRVAGGFHDTIKPDYSSPMEVKSTRVAPASDSATNYGVIGFGAGLSIFIFGVILLLAYFLTKSDNVKLGASVFLAAGSVTAALALLHGQTNNDQGD